MLSFLTNLALSLIGFIPSLFQYSADWFKFRTPAGLVLGPLIDNKKTLRVFVKDLLVPDNTFNSPKLFSTEGNALQANPYIDKVWPEVECHGLGLLQNLFGRLGKKDRIEIVEMSKGLKQWDTNFIVLGAQSVKSREFYEIMDNVGYAMDEEKIYSKETNAPIEINHEYGYGLIIKAERDSGAKKRVTGFLLGGFGTLGTAAAIYYFVNNIGELGSEFGNKKFSLVVRARISSGEQSVERLKKYDKRY